MTKTEVRELLLRGETLNSMFCFIAGQECEIYKAEDWNSGDEVIYIPDTYLNDIPIDADLSADPERVEEILEMCYTGQDFIADAYDLGGDEGLAEEAFWSCDWQHPSTVIDELIMDQEEDDE